MSSKKGTSKVFYLGNTEQEKKYKQVKETIGLGDSALVRYLVNKEYWIIQMLETKKNEVSK